MNAQEARLMTNKYNEWETSIERLFIQIHSKALEGESMLKIPKPSERLVKYLKEIGYEINIEKIDVISGNYYYFVTW